MFGDINLLPDDIIYRKLNYLKITGKAVLCLLLASILISAVLVLPYRRWMLEQELAEVNSKINAQGLLELEEAEKKLSEKVDEVKKFNEVMSRLPDNTVKISRVIDGIVSLMPESMTAADISCDLNSGLVTVNVISSNREDIALFLRRLYDEPLFTGINISAINGTGSDFRFTVMLTLKQP